MLTRPPSVSRKRRHPKRTARVREQDRERQRVKRERDEDGIVTFDGYCSAVFIEAMKARARFFGASKEEAERDADDPKKIAALAFDVLDAWAPSWYLKK